MNFLPRLRKSSPTPAAGFKARGWWFRVTLAVGLALPVCGCLIINRDDGRRYMKDGAAMPPIDYADPVLNQRKIVVMSPLNDLTAKEVILRLQYLDGRGPAPIDLYLNTDGGPVEFAFAIIDVMRSLKSPVNTWALGNCNSGGAMVLVAGTGRRFAFPNVVITIHGGKKIGRVPPDYVRIVDPQIDELWKQRARLPADWYPLQGDAMHFLTPDKALEYGVIDEIAQPPK